MSNPNAVATVTRFSLNAPERVVDEFLRLGVERSQLGPLDSFGFAKKRWKEIGYTAWEFLSFYERALDYIIELGRYGGHFPSNDRCKIYQGVFNILFNRIKNRRARNILDRWLDYH